MNEQISDDVVNKIRKLLALGSELNDSREQAELTIKKAKELAVQNDIDIAFIQVFENKKSEEPIVKGDELSLGKRKSVSQTFISWLLERHFKVQVIYTGNRYYGRRITLIGTTKNIAIATHVQLFLNEEFMRLWHQYREQAVDAQTKDRNSFMWGLYSGLSEKLKQQEETTENNTFATMSITGGESVATKTMECYALTKVSHTERLTAAVGEFYPKLRSTRHHSVGHYSNQARTAGILAGKNINIHPTLKYNPGQMVTS